MNLFEKARLWRALGHVVESKVGSAIAQACRQQVNWLAGTMVYTDNTAIPFTPFGKPLDQSCLALVSTAGFYMDGDQPFDVDSARGDASFRRIPSDVQADALKIAHTHYSHARANADINVLFPVDRLQELVAAGVVGRLATDFYSFGFAGSLTKAFIAQPDGTAHRLAEKLHADGVDYALLVPA